MRKSKKGRFDIFSIKKTFLWKIGGKIYRKLKRLKTYCGKYDNVKEEHIKHFGRDFPDKTFYVIRRSGLNSGLFSHFHSVLDHAIYAISKEYIPVVNMENYKIFCNEKDPIDIGYKKTSNAWEYFFEQPCGYSLKDIKKAKNVILSTMGYYNPARIPSSDPYEGTLYPDTFKGKEFVSKWYDFVSQYCKFNSKTLEHIECEKKMLFGDRRNILGVFHRGAGYNNINIKNHPIMPSIEQTIQKTKDVFQKENFDYIFVSTEEAESIEAFRNEFPIEKLIFIGRKRVENYDVSSQDYCEYSNVLYDGALDYLTEVYLLSQCDGIIASKAGGALAAMGLNNNKYRYVYKWDLGLKV